MNGTNALQRPDCVAGHVGSNSEMSAWLAGRGLQIFWTPARLIRIDKGAINTGAQWLVVSRIGATSSTDRAVVDPMSCRLDAWWSSPYHARVALRHYRASKAAPGL